jgi:hypothetical protein
MWMKELVIGVIMLFLGTNIVPSISVDIEIGSDSGNNPPDRPKIDGPTHEKYRKSWEYTFTSSDPENEDIYYYIEWGDGTYLSWYGPFHFPGYTTVFAHTWNEQGTYVIKAKAKDTYGGESDWGSLTVTMPYSYQSTHLLIKWLFQWYSHAFPLLRPLVGY